MAVWLRILLLVSALLASFASAQTLEEYLNLRKQYGIEQAAGVAALEAFVGTKVVEVSGVVVGSVGSGDQTLLILEGAGGGNLFVKATNPADWLQGNQVAARLLVEASRPGEMAMLEARLIGAAPNSQVAALEARVLASKPQPAEPKGGPPAFTPPANWTASLQEALPYYTAFIQSRNKKLSAQEAQEIAVAVLAFSQHYGVDARLIMAMVLVESGFDPDARSHAGAMGLGQLMPGTARSLGVSDAYDTEQNLYGTTKLIRQHLDKYGKSSGGDAMEALVLSLAAYNAGPGAVSRHGGVPPFRETQNYVRKVVGAYRQLLGQ